MPEVRSLADSVVPLAPMPSSRLAVLTVPPPYLSKRQLPLLLPAPRPLEPGALSWTERCTGLLASSAGRQFARSKSAGSGLARSRGPSSAETSVFSTNNQLNMSRERLRRRLRAVAATAAATAAAARGGCARRLRRGLRRGTLPRAASECVWRFWVPADSTAHPCWEEKDNKIILFYQLSFQLSYQGWYCPTLPLHLSRCSRPRCCCPLRRAIREDV